jgi:hypothetical protein
MRRPNAFWSELTQYKLSVWPAFLRHGGRAPPCTKDEESCNRNCASFFFEFHKVRGTS